MSQQQGFLRQLGFRVRSIQAATFCIVIAMFLLGLTGCAGVSSDLVSRGQVSVESIDSSRAQIERVLVRGDNGRLQVRGRLQKRHAGRSPIPGRLQVDVLGNDGEPLAQATPPYYRRSAKLGVSSFSHEFDVAPETVRTVRITHLTGKDRP